MAREISIGAPHGETRYVIIRRPSDAAVWSVTNSAFEVWANANIDDYDVQMTDRGGDLYDSDMPSAITTGNYNFIFYLQAGANPAITDNVSDHVFLYWNAASLVAAPPVGLSAFALISLDNIKRLLNIPIANTDKDSLLIQLINAATYRIEAYCSRKFVARDYKEIVFHGRSSYQVVLQNTPVIGTPKIGYGRRNMFRVSNTVDMRAMVEVQATQLVLITTSQLGVQTTNTLTFAANPTNALMVAAISLIGNYSATLEQNGPTEELWPGPGRWRQSGTDIVIEGLEQSSLFHDFDIQLDIGLISFTNMPARNSMVFYRGGFETTDERFYDIGQVCGEMVRLLYNQVAKDNTLTGSAIPMSDGGEAIGFITKNFVSLENQLKYQLGLLDQYRFVSIASAISR